MSHLINIEFAKKNGYMNTNVRDSVLSTILTRVQDLKLRPILGTSFFNRLIEGVTLNNLTMLETALLNDYIAKYLISAIDYKAVLHLHTEIRAKTVGHLNDSSIQSADNAGLLKLEDSIRKETEQYKILLISHLKDNCLLFPTYNDYICSFENVSPQKDQSTKPNIFFR